MCTAWMIFPVPLVFTPFLSAQFQGHRLPVMDCETLKLGNAVDFLTGSGPFSLRLAPNVMYGYVEVYLKTSGPGFQGQQSSIKKMANKKKIL